MNLDDYLRKNKISNREFAALIGQKESFVRFLRLGQRDPLLGVALKIVEVSEHEVDLRTLVPGRKRLAR